jgi:hypothetical protein
MYTSQCLEIRGHDPTWYGNNKVKSRLASEGPGDDALLKHVCRFEASEKVNDIQHEIFCAFEPIFY